MLPEIRSAIEAISSRHRVAVVSVAGFGGSGKTTFCNALAKELGLRAVVMSTDWYLLYPSRERRERIAAAKASSDRKRIVAEEHPLLWYDWDQFLHDLESLRRTGSLALHGAWNQRTGEKDLEVILNLPKKRGVILCDGIYLLHPPVSEIADLRILLKIDPAAGHERGAGRDRHRTTEEQRREKARFTQEYDVPYFDAYANAADIVVDMSDPEHPHLGNPTDSATRRCRA